MAEPLTMMLAAFGLSLAAPAGAEEAQMAKTQVPPARDGNVAIAEELCAADRAGTAKAYDLFIARHPDHPLAEVARKRRAALTLKP